MARNIITPGRTDFDPNKEFENLALPDGLELKIMPWIIFKGFDQFEHINYNSRSKPYPNGHFKTGTIRYSPGKVIIPFSSRLLAFESSEYNKGMPPYRTINIDKVIICPLEELTDEEISGDGFDSRKDMLWQMTEMEERYYPCLTPDSIISYLSFLGASPFASGNLLGVMQILPLMKKRYWGQLEEKDRTGWTEEYDILKRNPKK